MSADMPRGRRFQSFEFDPLALLRDPAFLAMSLEARGVYVSLLFNAWHERDPGVVPYISETRMARLAECDLADWMRLRHEVEPAWNLTINPGCWTSMLMVHSYAAQNRRWNTTSKRGKKGAIARWGNEKHAQALADAMHNTPLARDYPDPDPDLFLKEKDSPVNDSGDARNDPARRPRKPDPMAIPDVDGRTWADRFVQIYAAFPRAEGRLHALRAWTKLAPGSPELFSKIAAALRRYADEVRADGREKRFIKLPATWINARPWEDGL